MEGLCAVIKKSFKKHWRTIACQIYAVNNDENPKRGFLFDCGTPDVDALLDLVAGLKKNNLINNDIIIATVKEDVFILNTKKFHQKNSPILIDVSGRLDKPMILNFDDIEKMIKEIENQISNYDNDQLIELKIAHDWCIPTIFGYLINYPVLYYHLPDDDTNCLSLSDLKVYQVTTFNEILISFSIPKEVYERSKTVESLIDLWLSHFQHHDDYHVKTFIANYPTVIL